jgi:hypothetical protein
MRDKGLARGAQLSKNSWVERASSGTKQESGVSKLTGYIDVRTYLELNV